MLAGSLGRGDRFDRRCCFEANSTPSYHRSMSKQVEIREGARRQHRTIALYAALQCWLRGLDGIVIERSHLERLIGLQRFKRTRTQWLREDVRSYFPFVETISYVKPQGSLASLYACRIAFDLHGAKALRTSERLELIRGDGVKMEALVLWEQRLLPSGIDSLEPFVGHDERVLLACLTLLAQGQMAPQNIRALMGKPAAKRDRRAAPKSPRTT